MSEAARAFIVGALTAPAVEKTSKAGRIYVGAVLREAAMRPRLWTLLAFRNSARAGLMALAANEPVAVSGAFDCVVDVDQGKPRISWKLIVSTVQPPSDAAESVAIPQEREK